MDFSLTDEQKALTDLAAEILRDRTPAERVKQVEQTDDGYDAGLWAELAKAGLIGAPLPGDYGGSDGGFLDLCLLLEQQGRRVAPLPLLATLLPALAIARFGTEKQRDAWLRDVAAGQRLLSMALEEPGGDPRAPATTATPTGGGWSVTGTKSGVPIAHRAAAILVPARTSDGRIVVLLLDPKANGVTLERQQPMDWEPQFRLTLADVRVGADAVLGSADGGAAILEWIVDRATAGLCAIAAGACEEAVRLTAEYASNRKQFDKPIAMFQAVGQRLADSFIDHQAVQLTMLQAASRLADDLESACEIATAKYWAAEGGSRIGHAALHVHGGISIDVDYPIHRYFLWLKTIENTLGAATPQLVRLGDLIAAAYTADVERPGR
jgi:alkylation response protein AidB-like acyl-CoA dehydrogenase